MTLPLATFGNLMGMDGLLIFLVLLLLFGARKLPELARGLGQSLNEFKKARDDFEHEIKQGQTPPVHAPDGRQTFAGQPAAVPAQAAALPYNAPVQTAAAPESEAAMQQRIAELEHKLQSALEQSKQPSSHVG